MKVRRVSLGRLNTLLEGLVSDDVRAAARSNGACLRDTDAEYGIARCQAKFQRFGNHELYPPYRKALWGGAVQALRARLPSCCPSGTNTFRAKALIKLALMGFTGLDFYQGPSGAHPGFSSFEKESETLSAFRSYPFFSGLPLLSPLDVFGGGACGLAA